MPALRRNGQHSSSGSRGGCGCAGRIRALAPCAPLLLHPSLLHILPRTRVLAVRLKVCNQPLQKGVRCDGVAVGDQCAVAPRASDSHVHAPLVRQEAHLLLGVGAHLQGEGEGQGR